jgi:hypothetical protein
MSKKRRAAIDVEGLLKKTFPDDLPEDAAAAMRRRVERFRSEMAAEAKPLGPQVWLRRRGLWAALSVAMLLAGILLQGARASTPLADRITSLKAALAGLETTRR